MKATEIRGNIVILHSDTKSETTDPQGKIEFSMSSDSYAVGLRPTFNICYRSGR